jgi:hypothetical protein
MQPIRTLEQVLRSIMTPHDYLFSLSDLANILPNQDRSALKMVVSRAVGTGVLVRACHGIYMLADAPRTGLELFHIAAKVRAGFFNYISQETVLSDAGVISQLPINHATIMSSGASAVLNCGNLGSIEFTHTKRDLVALSPRLVYDESRRLLCATVEVAWEDLRSARRNRHLVDEEALDDLIR